MKVLLVNFSGTGHTTICGEFIKKAFIELGHTCEQHVLKAGQDINVNYNDYDLIGFGYPIHAFNVPQYFNNYIKSLPNVEHKKYFIYKVSGEPFHLNDASSYHVYKKLKKKGFELYAEKHFLMPYNIIFRYKDEIAKQMYLYMEPLTKAFVLGMLNNEPERIKYHFDKKVVSFLLRIEWVAPKLNSPFVHIKKKKCINCHKCINECPTGAMFINKKDRIRIKASKCAMCMRCTMYCPTDAITYGFMNLWKVNKTFNYKELAKNEAVNANYINHHTKGYFKLFNKYFDKQKSLLEKYNINNPVEKHD